MEYLIQSKLKNINMNIKNLYICDKVHNINLECNKIFLKPLDGVFTIKLKEFKSFIGNNHFKVSNIKLYNIFKDNPVLNIDNLIINNCTEFNILHNKVSKLYSIYRNNGSRNKQETRNIIQTINIKNIKIKDCNLNCYIHINGFSNYMRQFSVRYCRISNNANKILIGFRHILYENETFVLRKLFLYINANLIELLDDITKSIKNVHQDNIIDNNNYKNLDITENYMTTSETTKILKKDKKSKLHGNDGNDGNDGNYSLNIIDNYFNFNNTIKFIDYTKDNKIKFKFKCKRCTIFIHGEEPISKVNISEIEFNKMHNTDWSFTLTNLKILDLTESYWTHAFYKSIFNQNLLHMKSSHKMLINGCNAQYITLNLADICFNIDELYIKNCLPILLLLSTSIDNLTTEINKKMNIKDNNTYFISSLVSDVGIRLSYKSRGINFGRLIKGNSEEILRLGTIRDLIINFDNFSVNNVFSLTDLFTNILGNWERQLAFKSTTILSHIGCLKLLLSPTIKVIDIINLNDSVIGKLKKIVKTLSWDVLEFVTRTTVGLETIYESAIGDKDDESKFSKSPQNLKESYLMAYENKNSIRKSIRYGLIGLQSTIDSKQGYHNKMRYGEL